MSRAALSDNLVVRFALGTYTVSVVIAALTIAVVSVGRSLVGLELRCALEGSSGSSAKPLTARFGLLITTRGLPKPAYASVDPSVGRLPGRRPALQPPPTKEFG